MRKWHRWVSVFFGIFILWIAITGVLSQMAAFWPAPQLTPEAAALATPPEGFACPEGWRCMPPRAETGFKSLTGLFHHLHSGETFGVGGEIISLLSGLALMFFAVSGMWLYVQMWNNRRQRRLKGGMFWK